MYTPKNFNITDQNEIFSFIKQNAFGQLISNVDGRPFSSHIPFLLAPDNKKLFAHIAKQNPQHLSIDKQEVLITLDGPHGYISPSWYQSPGVPTWNYQTVHIYGICKSFNDNEQLKDVIDSLTNYYEANLAQPWVPNYKASMLNAIVGLEIEITEIQCKYKLSQNKSNSDKQSVISNLDQLGFHALSQAMRKV